MFRTSILALSASALLFGLAADAEAKRKRKKKGPSTACDMSYLPFVEGTTWKYLYVIPPGVEDRPGGIKAKQPEAFQIVVKKVESNGSSATITLEESYRKVVRNTTLRCSEEGLEVPLESFFFAGELPGAIGMSTEALVSKGNFYPGKSGLKKGESFYVELKGDVERKPGKDATIKHHLAKLEVERQITVGGREEVEVEHGIHEGQAVEVAISGRVTLAPSPEKPVPLPEGNAMLWFAPQIGLVRAYNRLGQGWELVEHNDASGAAIEP